MYTGPHIIKDGLVFGYDTGYGIADNTTGIRFYPGKPTSNLSNDMSGFFSNWAGMTGSASYYTTKEGNQGIHLITTNSGGVHFYSSSTIYNISANTQYTVSATIKYSGTTPHVNMFYVRQYHAGSQITEGGQFSTSYMVDLGDGWYRAYRTFTTTSTTSYINLQGYQYSNGVDLKIQDLQLEIGNQLSPYAGSLGARSSTASLIDLKETTDIDVSNVSFDSTGQPEFDGSDDKVVIANQTSVGSYTYETVVKINSSDSSYSGLGSNFKSDASGYSGVGNGWVLRLDPSGNLQVYTKNNSSTLINPINISGFRASNSNKYIHLVYTYANGANIIYLNGVSQQTGTGLSGTTPSDSTLIIGAYSWGIPSQTYYLNGHQPVVKLYNTTLSAEEITQNYNAYKNRFDI